MSAQQKMERTWRHVDNHLEVLQNAEKTVEMAQGYQKCLDILQPEVQARAPVGATGRLRSSIKDEVRVSRRGGLEGVVYTPVFYAHFVEMGTYADYAGTRSRHLGRWQKQRRTSRRGVHPRYFFKWAWERNKHRCAKILGDSVGKLVGAWKGGQVQY